MDAPWRLEFGANLIEPGHVQFRVWAPFARKVAVELVHQEQSTIPMQPASQGYFEAVVENVDPRARYRYVLDGN